jgi:PIN domain nuclease of toxin-antitoxin system
VSQEHLLDASALLALLLAEPGTEKVSPMLNSASIVSFTFAEVVTKLLQKGVPDPEDLVASLQLDINPEFTAKQAAACGRLHAATRAHGLSMGDCVCLSMAESTGAIAVTADRDWIDASVGRNVQVLCIR